MAALKFNLAAAARGTVGQLAIFDDIVAQLPAADFALPTRLGSWTVAELVGHLASANIARYLTGPSAAKAVVAPVDWARGAATIAASVDERAREASHAVAPAALQTSVHQLRAAVEQSVANTDDRFVVPARFGDMGVADYLATRCVELTVHSLDLTAALGRDPELDPTAAGLAARLLAGVLAVNAPGRSVELRIPPHTVVQCVEGPRHTRGTPPNVVEMDAVTWLEVATGRISWGDAERSARLSASGERADLSMYLPVLA